MFKKIKQMFSKNIDCADVLEDKIFYHYTSKNRTIIIGANIVVPQGFNAVFVCKDAVTDVLNDGKFAVNGANLPLTFKKLNIGKTNKKGKYSKKFIADVYYVSSKFESGLEFKSYTCYSSKCERLGKIKSTSEGKFDIIITDVAKLLKRLLSENAYINEDLFYDLLGGIVGDYINEILVKLNINFLSIVTKLNKVNEKLNELIEIEDYFSDYGFKIHDVVLQSMQVSGKLKNKIEDEVRNNKQYINKINQQLNIEIPKPVNWCEDDKLICSHCGHKLNKWSRFCEKCGKQI